ncbi:BTB/POZ domain-containing protein POB1 [Helianthus annuus]|uniref:BTB/POZ domain-containing protein POB1 n=1 Tax=Helianthus annuus TaxID=4232 RepID=UPI000B8FFE08|nr:BTB/POZ domain-containing protein POB1 [Helianthus annuus]
MTESNFELFDPKTFDPRTLIMDSPEDACDHGDFGFAFNDSNFSDRVLRIYIFSESPSAVRVKTLHISSPILAARSPFFYKLFSNGMRESEQFHATLRINASEEAGLMELLKFMYSNNLTVTSAPAVLDVLIAANKFDVASCMRHCSRLLRNLPMTPESVLVYLDLPSTIINADAFQPLTLAAKQFYVVHYKDMTKFEDEILSLPLAGVEVIIASDDLQVHSEDVVYNFVLKWARAQYPNIEDRREIIWTRLAKFIRYPYMTRIFLENVLICNEFDPQFAQMVVGEANAFKADVTHKYIIDENSNLNHRFVERAYILRPVKMVKFEKPRPRLVVYMDLKRDMCASLFPRGEFFSEGFELGGHTFYFYALCDIAKKSSLHYFWLYLAIREKEAAYDVFDYEFAARSKPSKEFERKSGGKKKTGNRYLFGTPLASFIGQSKTADEFGIKCNGKYVCTGGKKEIEYQYLFGSLWTSFIGEDSVYFVDGVLRLKVELTYRH